MKVLNLTNNKTSDIKFEVSKFPDGQQQVKILDFNHVLKGNYSPEYKTQCAKIFKNAIQIKARLNNFKDLELIICATKSLRNLGVKEIHLYTPYFLGSRSDRKFEEGSNNYLKDVICPIINSLNFESVTVLDSHSDVLEACLNNFKKVDNLKIVKYALESIPNSITVHNLKNPKEDLFHTFNCILISPDAGANKKIFKIAEQIGYTGDIITCSKSRDENGKLSHVVVPITDKYFGKDIIIIDDICDGGATFINIADKIIKLYNGVGTPKIYLIVSHGIFSKGFKELNKYFDGIYCTNSYSDLNSPEMTLKYDKELHKVTQLNIF